MQRQNEDGFVLGVGELNDGYFAPDPFPSQNEIELPSQANERKRKGSWPDATSTVAMSIYDMLAMYRRPVSKGEICDWVLREAHPTSDAKQITLALDGLLERGRVKLAVGFYSSRDPQYRIARWRNSEDIVVDYFTGQWTGGWDKWLVHDRAIGQVPIEEACL